ncbi:hypothetical protein RvY_10489 [Ramazzottius varieornatus]|uniref:Glucuronosyltransferase n=1 Tax=Ramazzottius varieornatus TaxID=947166 RepID=A0A1D1VFC3_RAMVA|nr:hypothetical protein RvY_10489 [Ramazzottius varieornatus]
MRRFKLDERSKMDQQSQRRHVLCVAFPAYGHMIPLLTLARKISEFHDVTFAVSESQHEELKRREILEDNDAHIKLFGIDDGFADDTAERFADDPRNMKLMEQMFQQAMDGVAKLISEIPTHKGASKPDFGIQRPVDVVITDNMVAGIVAPVKSRGPLFYLFNASCASFNLLVLSFNEDHPTCADEDAPAFQKVPAPGQPLLPITVGFLPTVLKMKHGMLLADGIIMNSFRGAEEEAIRTIQSHPEMTHIPLHCVGPLIPQVKETNVKRQVTEKKVKQWLDAKPGSSVIYVSFGSVAQLTSEQVREIAKALSTLDRPFIWSLKGQLHAHLPAESQKTLLSNLEDNNSGHLIVQWAPQKLVLAHPSVALFVSHCGWNSTIEGLASGKPFVAWPQFSDQLINAEFAEGKGAAVVIRNAGTKKGRLVKAEEVANAVRKAETECAAAARTWGQKMRRAIQPGNASYEEFVQLMQKFNDLRIE